MSVENSTRCPGCSSKRYKLLSNSFRRGDGGAGARVGSVVDMVEDEVVNTSDGTDKDARSWDGTMTTGCVTDGCATGTLPLPPEISEKRGMSRELYPAVAAGCVRLISTVSVATTDSTSPIRRRFARS